MVSEPPLVSFFPSHSYPSMASTINQEPGFPFNAQGVPILLEKNYELWNVLMKTFLISEDLWDTVEEGFTPHTAEEVAAMTNAKKKNIRRTR